MLLKIFKKDVKRNYIILSILFFFMTLSVVLVSSGTFMIHELYTSVGEFFEKSDVPHVVQMHAGAIDEKAIERFSSENPYVKDYQLSRMLSIGNQEILFEGEKSNTSIMDLSFVKQNKSFDFLLNTENNIVPIKENYIGVPVYYQERMDLEIGDMIRIQNGSYNKEFKIQYFLRDAQMNAPIISSKRFLINPIDYEVVSENFENVEYLIEFKLTDTEKIEIFKKQYTDAALPSKGPMVDRSLFKIMNALSDGIIAVVIIFVSLLLMAIALLCIRFSIITTLEEDFESIGTMKTIGFQYSFIKRIYHFKYIFISILATILGYFISFQINPILTKNISLYMGSGVPNLLSYVFPLLGSILIMILMILFCGIIINRFKRVSPVATLQMAKTNGSQSKGLWSASSLKFISKLPTNAFLALKDVFMRSKMYSLLALILVICLLIVLIPFNFLTTLSDPSFTAYMGIGESDIRVDIQNIDDGYRYYQEVLKTIEKDPGVEKVSGYVTSQYEVLNSDGYYEGINIEVGDFSDFPIKLLNGKMPKQKNEIALSKLNADGLDIGVNESITVNINGEEKSIKVTGIYQDITNGGKTAKGILPIRENHIIWQTISVDLDESVNLNEKIIELNKRFPSIKVTGIQGYIEETFKETIKQVTTVIKFSITIALALLVLITSLFTKMIVIKDQYEISILRSIGISKKNIIVQYILRIVMVSLIAMVIASVIGNTLGASIVSLLMSFLGASKIDFIIDPIMVYLKIPLAFMAVISCVVLIVTQSIKNIEVNQVFN